MCHSGLHFSIHHQVQVNYCGRNSLIVFLRYVDMKQIWEGSSEGQIGNIKISSDLDFMNKESRLTCWGSSTTVTYSTIFPPPSDTTTEVITHSCQKKSAGMSGWRKHC